MIPNTRATISGIMLFACLSLAPAASTADWSDNDPITLPDASVYVGELRDGLFHGTGRLSYPDGRWYQGEFRSGLIHGEGEYHYQDSASYVGALENGKFHGRGVFTTAGGEIYTGSFVDDAPSGQGKIVSADGAIYEGEWRDWLPHGAGKYVSADGDVYVGRFDTGTPSGVMEITKADGSRYRGEVSDWYYHGRGTLITNAGDRYDGEFEYGSYEGDGDLLRHDGQRYVGRFSDDLYHGTGTLTLPRPDGNVETLTGRWEHGRFVGPGAEHYIESGIAVPDVEALLFNQKQLLDTILADVPSSRPETTDVFVVTYAGDGGQDVFMKEAQYATEALSRHWGPIHHTINLVNNTATAAQTPLATVPNLRHTLTTVAQRMDPQEDILLLFLTSHGSSDGTLSVEMPGGTLRDLTAVDLADMLDDVGIRWRVVIISACYSGSFIKHLASPQSLVLTSSRADRTSFGCSDEADLTYFGKAFFEQALPGTDSLVAAFFDARRFVAEREQEDGYEHSEPQIHVGGAIENKLAQRREGVNEEIAASLHPNGS